jgi:hypothetical protein
MNIADYARTDRYKEEVAIVHLAHRIIKKNINLVGAIHIGSPGYYNEVMKYLNRQDVALYELVKEGKGIPTEKDKFLFCEGLHLGEFYKSLAIAVSEYQTTKIEDALEPLIQEDPHRASIINKYKESCLEELRLVFQADAIDYKNLPKHWQWADIDYDELKSHIEIVSLENLAFGLIKIVSYLQSTFPELNKEIGKMMVDKGIIALAAESKLNLLAKTNEIREETVYRKIMECENDERIRNIGIFYGIGHFPNMEATLAEKGYYRTGIDFVEAIRKQTKDIENNRPLP